MHVSFLWDGVQAFPNSRSISDDLDLTLLLSPRGSFSKQGFVRIQPRTHPGTRQPLGKDGPGLRGGSGPTQSLSNGKGSLPILLGQWLLVNFFSCTVSNLL